MNSLNSVIEEGTLTDDPYVCDDDNSKELMCSFKIASNRYFKHDGELVQETSFFDIETTGKIAEHCAEKCKKGCCVRVIGRLKQDRWTGENGKPCSRVKIVGDHVEYKPITNSEDDE